MARLILCIMAVAVALAASLVAAQSSGNLHEACYTGADGAVWRIYSDDSGTKFSRTIGGVTTTKSTTLTLQNPPAEGQPWPQGVQAANYLIGQRSPLFYSIPKDAALLRLQGQDQEAVRAALQEARFRLPC
jgi:hypothetical protein